MIDPTILDAFQPISLDEMGKVRLMNRIDTKFVTSLDKALQLLRIIAPDYRMQKIGKISNMPYYTRYYDTPDVRMFYEHQRGKKNRQKIRVRLYEECNMLPFIEVKTKNNKGRTHKKRVLMKNGWDILLYRKFLKQHTPFSPTSLIPQIENHFYRLTLVNKDMTERITIDTDLEFHNLTTDGRLSLDKLAIIEWKRDGRNCKSDLNNILTTLRIHPGGFSKYCVGMVLTNPLLKHNRIKDRIRRIRRLLITQTPEMENVNTNI